MKITKYMCTFICLIILAVNTLLGQQKPIIDASAIKTWTEIRRPEISNDGKYFFFHYDSQIEENRSLVLQSTTGEWKRKINRVSELIFSDDSKSAIFINEHDSLCFIYLGTNREQFIPNVLSYKLFMQGKTQWIAYSLKNGYKQLVFRTLSGEHQQHYNNVTHFATDESGKNVALITEKDTTQTLIWLDLITIRKKIIWEGANAQNLIFDAFGSQLAFEEMIPGEDHIHAIWHYKSGDERAVKLLDKYARGVEKGLNLVSLERFSKTGTELFLGLREKDLPKAEPDAVKVDIWSFTDSKLQPQQLENTSPPTYCATINFATLSVLRLQQEGEDANIGSLQNLKTDDLLPVYPCTYDVSLDLEFNWNNAYKTGVSLVSTKTGERKAFIKHIVKGLLSPSGQYVIGMDKTQGDYFCYDIKSDTTINITQQLPIPHIDPDFDYPLSGRTPRGLNIQGWLQHDKAVLISDGYDIWQLDPANTTAPINLTNAYGRKNQIRFLCLFWEDAMGRKSNDQRLLLSVFNKSTKEEGFSSLVLGKQQTPELLLMGPYKYSGINAGIKKANYADVYLITRNSSQESPNCFITKDFKKLTRLTDNRPQNKYNWFTTELHTFKTADKKTTQGVLYKPENIDTTKKYPIIFLYYEKMSDGLNEYKLPAEATGEINIPWFASRGYLIFTPDIHYEVGAPMESALNTVVGAANYLKRFSYVDSNKMGLQGHSFGGAETNYIITRTHIFAAACSAAGISDQISHYGGLFRGGMSAQPLAEVWQTRLGTTLWSDPEIFINNSPIFNADQITTPLQIMHCKDDHAVPFSQSVELMTAMRRLGKRAWMLQYDEGDHTLNKKDGMDFQLRMTQFFDHYLKNARAPKWMGKGIPAKLKGLKDGLELDSSYNQF